MLSNVRSNWNGDTLGNIPIPITSLPFESVERRVEISTEGWARDLRALFDHAKERFGDVSWENEGGEERVWGHKAIIYARAPKAFKERYFISKPFARTPTSLRSPSPQPQLLPPLFPPAANEPPSSYRLASQTARGSTLTVNTFHSEGTLRSPQSDGILRLTHGDTPELFQAQLEWLYTGEGFGDVVEWISAEDDSGLGGSIRDSLGRRGNIHERRDKLGQDLTYMWRSKLYADVRIHLDPLEDVEDGLSEDGSEDSIDSLSSTAVFASHKFILVSRSPYFASLLLNHNSFAHHNGDIHLPTPPFTPASLHFCLGWIYAGHLDFSNRTFDLTTALQIHRAANYLQLDALVGEIESRVVHDFCHGFALPKGKVHCKRCPLRVARAWRFACAPDASAVRLAAKAREFLIAAWADSWGREIALADESDRISLLRDVIKQIKPNNIVATYRSIGMVKSRMEAALRMKGRDAADWIEVLEGMIGQIQAAAQHILLSQFAPITGSKEMWELLGGTTFDIDLLETVGKELLGAVSTSTGCVEGPRIYQALVSSILLKVDSGTLQTILPARGQNRQQIEQIKDGVLDHIRRRWMQVRDGGGFDGVENWALKEISDEIEIPVGDLLATQPTIPKKAHFGPSSSRPASAAAEPARFSSMPSTSSRIDLASISSGKSSLTSRPTAKRPITPPDASGLRRLRLSSSASTNSVNSSRSRAVAQPQLQERMTGPQARSPTAARQGSTVSIGAARRSRINGATSPSPSTRTNRTSQVPTIATPRSLSGPPRPLLTKATRPSPSLPNRADTTPSPAPSVTGIRTVKTTIRSDTTIPNGNTRPSVIEKTKVATNAEAGPSRLRTASASTVGSVRKTAAPKIGSSSPASRNVSTPVATTKDRTKLDVSDVRQRTSSTTTTTSVRSRVASINSRAQAETTTKRHPLPRKGNVGLTNAAPSGQVKSVSATASGRSAAPTTRAPSISNASSKTPAKAPSIAPSIASRTSLASRATVGGKQPSQPSPATSRQVSSTAGVSTSAPAKTGAGLQPKTTTPGKTLTSVDKPSPAKPSAAVKSGASPSRSRLASARSTASATSTPTDPAKSSSRPTLKPMKPIAFPAAAGTAALPGPMRTKSSVRSASSSTDDAPEARTPRNSLLPAQEPKILRDGSDMSDMAFPGASAALTGSSPTKHPPVAISMPRPARKVSSSSTRSNSSAFHLHPASAFDPPRRFEIPSEPLSLPKDLPPGVERFEGKGVELHVGIPCIVSLQSKRARFRASIKYIGHLKDCRGAWVGLEVDDLDRLGVSTLSSGTIDQTHYFGLSQKVDEGYDEQRLARQKRIEQIRETLRKSSLSRLYGTPGLGSGMASGIGMNGGESLGVPNTYLGGAGGVKRSLSPFGDYVGMGGLVGGQFGFEKPRALFVRPSEIVFVMGAE